MIHSFEDKTVSSFMTAGQEVEAIRINIPSGQIFELTHFGNEVDDAAAWGAAQWDIYVDGSPARNFTNIKDQLGIFSQMRKLPPGFITATRDLVIYMTNNVLYSDGVTPNASTFKLGVSIQGQFKSND